MVHVLERKWRPFVAVLQETDANSAIDGRDFEEALLVVPMDIRIPLIRIRTRNAFEHKNNRIVVNIDNWSEDSMFPDGHFIKSIGAIGDRDTETEVSILLLFFLSLV